jgi:glycosyltransferase involved in cell wall biosynthesis
MFGKVQGPKSSIGMKTLYISYDGITDPLGESQIVPYLVGLAEKGVNFFVLSFEKKNNLERNDIIQSTKKYFSKHRIYWIPLKYHKFPKVLSTLYDVFMGTIIGVWVILKNRVRIVHARVFVGALIAVILKKIFTIKFILDFRGFWVEERVDANIFKKGGWLYNATKYLEKIFLINSNEIVILTEKGKEKILEYNIFKNRQPNITVITTCVDIDKFKMPQKVNRGLSYLDSIPNKFIFSYIGSLSTWYMPEEMLRFFDVAKRYVANPYLLFLTKEVDYLKGIISKFAISGDLYGIKYVPHSMISNYLSFSKVGIAFYKPCYSRNACCPTKLGEYLASGLPVIINKGIGDCDTIIEQEKVGIIVKEFSEREYERVVKELNNLLLGEDILKKRCYAIAEKYFSLEKGVNKYLQIYRNLRN